jgi:putative DNA primase/helicase
MTHIQQDIDSECTVLACMNHFPDTVPFAMEQLTSLCFHGETHRQIFDVFAILHATGQETSLVNLASSLNKNALNYFAQMEDPGSEELIKPAIKKLKLAAALREMSGISAQIQIGIQRGEDVSALVSSLHKKQNEVPDSLTIHGVEKLTEQGQIIIFFDRKSMNVAEEVIPGLISIACSPTIKKLSKINWSALAGRKIAIWREDHIDAAEHLFYLISKGGAEAVWVIRNPPEHKPGFSIINAVEHLGWDAARIYAYIKSNLYDPKAEAEDIPRENEQPPANREPASGGGCPFQILGHDHNVYYFLPNGSKQVVPLGAAQLSQAHLITLADVNYWELHFPGGKGGNANWNAASNWLVRECESQKVYDPRKLRGRGAWEDAGRSVLHLGDHMYVNGEPKQVHEIQSDYIYEAAAAMEYNISCDPLKSKEAQKIVEICEMLTWEKPINALLLAGWIAIAPICGALTWRPHIHVTGKSGTGKSTTIEQIIAPLVGPSALQVNGSGTSAAGIRQALGCDARPVIHDEFDTKAGSLDKSVEAELELARSCSSDTRAATIKGGADGRSKTYITRSAFCWSSIMTHADMAADITRITVLTLVESHLSSEQKRANYDKLMEKIITTLTPEFCCSLRARMVRLIPQVNKNAQTFARAGALNIGTQRAGDQLGAIIAGAYALSRSDEISFPDAVKWIEERSQDWNEYKLKGDQLDESRCLSKILEYIVRAQGDRGGISELSIGELIQIAASPLSLHSNITASDAETVLRRHGVKMFHQERAFAVSNRHSTIEKCLEKTPWGSNWGQLLARLPEAMKLNSSIRFGSTVSKAVLISLSLLEGGD